jgi:hypothetical protein
VNNVEASEVIKAQLRCDDRQQFMAIGWRKALELAVTALEHQPEPQTESVDCIVCGSKFPITNGDYSQAYAHAESHVLAASLVGGTNGAGHEALACDSCRTIVPNLETVVCPRCGSVDLRHIQASDIGRQEVK